MTVTAPQDRSDAKTRVLDGLARLRAAFPLEQRVLVAEPAARAAYALLLRHWLRAQPPPDATIDATLLAQLARLDAVVPEEHGLGCYPFSSVDTGIRVTLPAGTVHAMCAIDALAIARLARAHTHIDATCATCGTAIACRVEENGSLDHDQAEMARVVWQPAGDPQTSCSRGLCRQIRFLCRACPESHAGACFTLPQAAAIGNAFFRFQSALLAAHALTP
jgi:hypothetical protein